jgi:5S rRNA maturation endonuclease (ribonuclease M5)
MESSLSEGGIQYKIKLSLSNGSNDLYYFKLHDKKTRKDISLNEASDTEKALLMAGALRWYFNGAEKMDMLLLDEPDSHIDPARISVFIDIIGSVTNHLAISSHSLTTIDLFSNDDNWDLVSVEKKSEDNFELSRITGNDIELAKHRYRVCGNKSYINTDSESYISALLRSRFKDIIVFVEGKTDKIYLNKAIEYLKINNKDFNNNIEVVSYSSASIPEKLPEGNSIENNGGASQVANVCQFAIKSDFYNTNKNNIQKIFFLFDNDPAGIYEDERSTKGLKSENKKLEKYKEWKYKKIESHGIYIARLPRYNIIKEEFYSIEAFRNGPINNKTKVAEKYKINNSEDSFCRIILDIQSIVSI